MAESVLSDDLLITIDLDGQPVSIGYLDFGIILQTTS